MLLRVGLAADLPFLSPLLVLFLCPFLSLLSFLSHRQCLGHQFAQTHHSQLSDPWCLQQPIPNHPQEPIAAGPLLPRPLLP